MAGYDHEVDSILGLIGIGRWQIVQVIWLYLLYLAWIDISLCIVLIGYVPDFACSPSANYTIGLSDVNRSIAFDNQCEVTNVTTNTSELCMNGFIYAEPKEVSIVSEWDLVCGQSVLSEFSQTVLTIGQTIGSIIFTPLADKFGRRHVFIWNHALLLAASTATSFVPSISLFIVLRAFIGAFLAGASMVSWVVTLEMFVPEHRTKVAIFANLVWGICACSLPTIGYLFRGMSWRYIHLSFTAFVFVWFGQFFAVNESFRWLIANGRRKEALKMLKQAAKKNRTDPSIVAMVISRYFYADVSATTELAPVPVDGSLAALDYNTSVGEKGKEEDNFISSNMTITSVKDSAVSPLAIIQHPRLRKVFLIMAFAWFTNALTYYGLYMVSSTLPGNRYLHLFINTSMEILSALVMCPVLLRVGRRIVCLALHTFTGVSMIIAAILFVIEGGQWVETVQMCFAALSKFGITATFNLVFMYSPEVFPTNIRSMGVGLTSVASRIGGFIAPFSATVARSVPWVPTSVFGGLCLCMAFLSIYLPETLNRDLPQTLQDLDELDNKVQENKSSKK